LILFLEEEEKRKEKKKKKKRKPWAKMGNAISDVSFSNRLDLL